MSETDKPEYYVLEPVYPPKPGEFVFVNASVGYCGLCGRMTTGMGGGPDQICVPCAEVVMSQRARGAIKWEDERSPESKAIGPARATPLKQEGAET